MAVQLQLIFDPEKQKQPPLTPGDVIIPRPWAWQEWVFIILDHGLDGEHCPRRYNYHYQNHQKRLKERLKWFSIFTYEPGVCKQCRSFVWCDDGKPRQCRRCQNTETISTLSELAPYF